MSSAGEEMKNPKRDVPRVIFWSGALIAVLYSFAIGGILFAVPIEKLSIVTGTWDALAVLGKEWGRAGDTAVLSARDRVPLRVRRQRRDVEPRGQPRGRRRGRGGHAARRRSAGCTRASRRRTSPSSRWGSSRRRCSSEARCSPSSQSNIFWMTFRITALCLLLCYLLVFPAFLVLRTRRPDQPRPYRLPGGAWRRPRLAAWVCTLYIVGACVLFFVPSPTSQEPLKEAVVLGLLTLATLVAGYLLIPRRSRTAPSV